MPIEVDFSFDKKTYRHFMNGLPSVLHCHHYIALTVQLAEQLADVGATRILMESMEDAVRPLLDDYYRKKQVTAAKDRLEIAAEFFCSVMGLGKMEFDGGSIKKSGGSVALAKSHTDQGWQMKFGKADRPLNYPARGYLMAMFAAAFDAAPHSYTVEETKSIAMGADRSEFVVKQGDAR